MKAVSGLNHVTLCCSPGQLATVQDFYEAVLGLKTGPRPSFDFPGAWLYAGQQPIVHLAAVLPEPFAGTDSTSGAPAVLPGAVPSTGAIDHIALRAIATVDEVRTLLRAHDVSFTEAPVPGFPLYQVFCHDPLGVKIELNF